MVGSLTQIFEGLSLQSYTNKLVKVWIDWPWFKKKKKKKRLFMCQIRLLYKLNIWICSDAEHTLMKLKQGSQNDTNKGWTSRSISLNDEAITPEADYSSSSLSTTTSPTSNDCRSIDTTDEHHSKSVSILYVFSPCKSSHHALSSGDEESMVIEDRSCSASASPSSLASSTR